MGEMARVFDVQGPVDTPDLGGFIVRDAALGDAGRGVVRLDPADLTRLAIAIGDFVALSSAPGAPARTIARAMPAYPIDRGLGAVQIDALQRANAGVGLNGTAHLAPVEAQACTRLSLAPGDAATADRIAADKDLADWLLPRLETLPMTTGDRLQVIGRDGTGLTFAVIATLPRGPVFGSAATRIILSDGNDDTGPADAQPVMVNRFPAHIRPAETGSASAAPQAHPAPNRPWQAVYDDLRETMLKPLGDASADRMRVMLVTGRAGCGKTSLAKALAATPGVHGIGINGLDLLARGPDAAAAWLRAVFDSLKARAPAVLVIDDLDVLDQTAHSDPCGPALRMTALLARLIDDLGPDSRCAVIGLALHGASLPSVLCQAGRFDWSVPILDAPAEDRRQSLSEDLTAAGWVVEDAPEDLLDMLAHWPPAAAASCVRRARALVQRSGAGHPDWAHLADAITEYEPSREGAL